MAPANAAEIVSFPTFAKPVPREQFINAMGQAVTGVTIITTSGGAGRAERDVFESKFDCTVWGSLVTGARAMGDALAVFDCRLQTSQRLGSHGVFFGIVVGTRTSEGVPLHYAGRAYRPAAVELIW